MTQEGLSKIGLTKSDFDDELESENDLISSVTTSGRLYRKAIQHIILKKLRVYFDDPQLNDSDEISKYFKYGDRKKRWSSFREAMEFKTPALRVEKFAVFLMLTYLLGYGYFVLDFLLTHTNLLAHVSLSGLSVSGLVVLGAFTPPVIMFHLGKTRLPAKSVGGLVDKIIQENMHDLLTNDRENLKRIIRHEISVQ